MGQERHAWDDLLHLAVGQCAPRLTHILNADGCRESWLQGELFLILRDQGFKSAAVNKYQYEAGRRTKADLWVPMDNRCGLVAEIKVLGMKAYYPKVIDGKNSITHYLPKQGDARIDVTKATISAASGNSLLRDWARLNRVPPDLQRVLLLVLQDADDPDDVGRSLRAIRLPGREKSGNHEGFMVRTWTLE